jgi:exodeoxyribonuclease V gamma subunit
MIRLVYADRAERLVDALAEQLAAARRAPGVHPLDPIPLVVPNQAATAYLKMALARRLGVAANLRVDYLQAFLARTAEAAHPERRVLDTGRLQVVLLHVLAEVERSPEPHLEPVLSYLDAAQDDPVGRDLRRVQLATHLARIYDEYILTRPELMARWGEDLTPSHPVERWERALWRRVRRALEARGLWTLPDAYRALAPAQGSLPPRLYLWDVTVGGSVLQTALARLARHAELWMFTLNPCQEYWEDVERLQGNLLGEDPFGLQRGDGDTPALRLWGRPGRENIRLLNALTDCDFEARFSEPDPAPATVLAQLQEDVLVRAPERAEGALGLDDDSVRFTACASVRREVEAIAQRIWALVEATPELTFDRIAVVLPALEADTYRAHIGAVFKERHQIPHHALEVPLSGSSRVVEAVELLLALPHSGFTRQDLLRLVTHPVVISRFEDARADDWIAWCEALAVVHGADHGDHQDTYIKRDLYNWDQGLRRLVLGTFMSGPQSQDERSFEAQGQRYLPHEYPLDRMADASRLVVLVRSLVADARFAAQARLPLSGWATFLRTLVTAYVTPANEQDERDLLRTLSALDGLGELDDTDGPLAFREAAELLRQRLSGLTSNHGQPLAEGVVVAPLALVAALPFRVVFMPGLGEGHFPASERRSQLDLRSLARRAGDVSPRERDQYWFLQRLMATQDRLHISWVSRNAQTGDRLEPAPTVAELIRILQRGYLSPSASARLVESQPLRRYDPNAPDDPFDSQAALRERQILALRRDLQAHLGPGRELPRLAALRAALERGQWAPVARRLRLAEPEAAGGAAERVEVRYAVLRRFLEDPLQGWAEQVLGLRADDAEVDPYAREDELFRTEPLDRRNLLTEVFLAHAAEPSLDLEALYEARAEQLELLGVMPTGVFKESEERRHLSTLRAWRTHLRRATLGAAGPVEVLRFGRAQEHARQREVAEPLLLTLSGGLTVELRGATEALVPRPAGSFTPMVSPPARGALALVPELRALLDHALLAARGQVFEAPYAGWTAYADETQEGLHTVTFSPLTPTEARSWLAGLLEALLFETHAYLLPFPVAVGLFKARDRGHAALEEVLSRARPAAYGPLAGAEVAPPEPEEALHILDTRLRPFFSRRQGELP